MVDYSRWNRIEISDDEDDTHPNIDTGSLFRWRHKARLERMQQQREARENLEKRRQELQNKLDKLSEFSDECQRKILEEKQILDKEKEELDRRERLQPWNVDTISHDSWSKTLVNRKCLDENSTIDETNEETEDISDEKVNRYSEFIKQNESSIQEFAFYSNFDLSRRHLLENPHLACQHSLDYLMLWCLQLKLDQKKELLEHIARQAVLLQIILDLAKSIRGPTGASIDPRDCLPGFFTKARQNWKRFHQLWMDELDDFHKRVETAAQMRLDRAVQEQLESGKKIIGPGGLDAQEVFDSLPEELQECFEKRDPEMLRNRLSEMDPADAEQHMQRCIDAGLWETGERVPDQDELFWMKIKNTKQHLNDLHLNEDEHSDEDN